jgi:DNA (cytosine-5)-methyltransferase 1
MKVLNLYAGIGGNRKLWTNVEVTAVEHDEKVAEVYQDIFPQDNVVVADAHEYLLHHFELFDFIWASPPCQSHSKFAKINHSRYNHRRYPDMMLYQEIIFLREYAKQLFVVENVKPYYDVLIPAIELDRHLFWSNFKITAFKGQSINLFDASEDDLRELLGYQFDKRLYIDGNHDPRQVFRNCVHPELGLHILNCARGKFTNKVKQTPLFE